MNDLDYLKRCEGGAQEWRKYAKMSLKERLGKVKRATDSCVLSVASGKAERTRIYTD
jgi:hypothetical protein